MRMTGATFTIKGMPISRLRWRTVNTDEGGTVVHIDLKGYAEFRVSEKYLTDVWRWIYEKFTLFILGDKDASNAPAR
jgi:hypothetical protein